MPLVLGMGKTEDMRRRLSIGGAPVIALVGISRRHSTDCKEYLISAFAKTGVISMVKLVYSVVPLPLRCWCGSVTSPHLLVERFRARSLASNPNTNRYDLLCVWRCETPSMHMGSLAGFFIERFNEG